MTIPGREYIIYAEITGHSTKSVRWSPGQAAFETETVIFYGNGAKKERRIIEDKPSFERKEICHDLQCRSTEYVLRG